MRHRKLRFALVVIFLVAFALAFLLSQSILPSYRAVTTPALLVHSSSTISSNSVKLVSQNARPKHSTGNVTIEGKIREWLNNICPELTREEVEKWLNANGRDASSLLTIVAIIGPGAGDYLKEALSAFPDDPSVLQWHLFFSLDLAEKKSIIDKLVMLDPNSAFSTLIAAHYAAEKQDHVGMTAALERASHNGANVDFSALKANVRSLFAHAGRDEAGRNAWAEVGIHTTPMFHSIAVIKNFVASDSPQQQAALLSWVQMAAEGNEVPLIFLSNLNMIENELSLWLKKNPSEASHYIGFDWSQFQSELSRSTERNSEKLKLGYQIPHLFYGKTNDQIAVFFSDMKNIGASHALKGLSGAVP